MNNILRDKFFNRVVENFDVMSTVVIKQMEYVKQLLNDGKELDADKEQGIYREIYNNELILDSLDVKLRREVINAIVLYSPRATDLRQMMSNYDMVGYVERVGDLVLNIAHFLSDMNKESDICRHYRPDIVKLVDIAANMVKRSILSFNYEDNAMARDIINDDDKVDDLYKIIGNSIRSDYGGQSLSNEQIIDLLGVSGISYNLERIGDNATNMAEAAIYFAEGKDVKHSKLKKEEEEHKKEEGNAAI